MVTEKYLCEKCNVLARKIFHLIFKVYTLNEILGFASVYLTLKVGQMHWLRTSVTHYPLTLHSIQEDWRPVNKLTWINLENV